MGGYGLAAVVISIHLVVCAHYQGPDISPRLSITGVTTDSLDVSWTFSEDDTPEIQQVYISVLYMGPCANPQAPPPPVAVLTTPTSDLYTITGLVDFSMYAINVTIETGRGDLGESVVTAMTIGTAPSSQATELTLRESRMTALLVTWVPIPCQDLHSRLEQFTLTATPLSPAQDTSIMTLNVFSTDANATIPDLTPSTGYNITLSASYTISSSDRVKATRVAETITGTTFSIPGPYNLRATAAETVLSVSWLQEESTDNLTAYEVAVQYTGSCPSITHDLEDTTPISSRMYVFENLTEFGMYRISVIAVSVAGQRAKSRVTVQTLPTAPGAPPTLQVTDIQAFSVTLTWEPLDCADRKSAITGYVLYYGPSEQYQEPGGRSNITTDVATTTASIEVMPLTIYYFQAAAVNREGLVGPLSPLINITTLSPPPPPDNLTVNSIEATSAVLSWTLTPGVSYIVVVRFSGPCMDVLVPTHTMLAGGGASNVTGLEEFSTYVATVTPQGGGSPAVITFSTLTADPTPSDDHVQYVSSTDSTVVFQVPPISCIDLNGHQVEYRLIYAQTVDFVNGSNVRSGLFRPGVVIVGNLQLATEYTFQLILHLMADGGNVSLAPITASTLGTAVTTVGATPPTPPAPTGLGTGVIAATVVVVVGVTIGIVMAIATVTCVVIVKRRGRKAPQKTDKQILTEKEAVVSNLLKEAAKKEAAKKEAVKKKSLSNARESRKATPLFPLSDWTKGPGQSKPNPIADPALKMTNWLAESRTKTLEDWTSMLATADEMSDYPTFVSLSDWLSTATTVSTLEDHTPSKQGPRLSAHRMEWMKDFGASPSSTMYADDYIDEEDDFNFAEDVQNDGY